MLTKKTAVDRVAKLNPGLTKRLVNKLIGDFIDEMKKSLASGQNVELRYFGVFELRQTKPRQCKAPKGEGLMVYEGGPRVGFKPSRTLKALVRAGQPSNQ